jgi:hypothetical protein
MVLLRDFEVPEVVHADDATVQAAFDGIGLTRSTLPAMEDD